jgi:hypothetical protein
MCRISLWLLLRKNDTSSCGSDSVSLLESSGTKFSYMLCEKMINITSVHNWDSIKKSLFSTFKVMFPMHPYTVGTQRRDSHL